jgi:hypothetical protein
VQVSQGSRICGHDSTKSRGWGIRISLKPRSDAKPLVQKACLLRLIDCAVNPRVKPAGNVARLFSQKT